MEATPSDSILVANDPEASSKAKQPHIPSVQASSFRKATETTKNVVTTRDNRMCWLCCIRLPSSLEVAYNINASVSLDLVCSSFLFISLVLDFVLLVETALTMYSWRFGKGREYCQSFSTLRTPTTSYFYARIAIRRTTATTLSGSRSRKTWTFSPISKIMIMPHELPLPNAVFSKVGLCYRYLFVHSSNLPSC
jgi:hypothetical protein